MATSKTIFKQIDMYCNECSLAKEVYEIERRKELQGQAQHDLGFIINSDKDNEIKTIARVALNKCKECDYSEPEIHRYLDTEKMI